MRILATLVLIPVLAHGGDMVQGELGWLAGCWDSADKSGREVWVQDDKHSLAGFSVALNGSKVGFHEVLRIRQDKNGGWAYTAHPAGQAPATFSAAQITANSVVFTNPGHDYPQQIRYQKTGKRLVATISLLGGDNPNVFDKAACE
ncbi:MAG: hypothetical protein HKO64_12265 [Xanthomonadales bacterium]|nr:hypothetical protein [Xanthomonadales bacterium]NNL96388.1 hypothetical protein [Xanthomonadales bacterium]